jgi:Zn finger protein HypA/HybF involved in hydrogenase expression
MKRKTPVKEIPVVDPEILESAHRSLGLESLSLEKSKPARRCEVCEGEVTPNAVEQLCWVCRRLKISAWRDSDLQASTGGE